MNVNQALKQKNFLAKEIAKKQTLLQTQNIYKAQNESKLEYNTKNILGDLLADVDKLVETKSAIARANHEVYPKIFRLAEIKGLIQALKGIPVRQGVEQEPYGYRGEAKDVEWKSTLNHHDLDKQIEELEREIQSIQDDLDTHNFTTDVQI